MSVRRFLPRLEKKFAGLTVETVAEDGSFSGYASLFGEVDLGKDAIQAGAFRKSVLERGAAGIRMLWQHDPNQPIGTWTQIREDKRGLYVEGKLAKGVAKAAEVLELMRSGAIDGLSIGFRTVRAKADSAGIRHIHEADLWEISVVTFPMLPSARVGQVKSLAEGAGSVLESPCQPRILWNIKANEVLIEALKLSPRSDHNRQWMARLEAENEALKSHSTLYEPFQIWYRKYNPDQPRVSAGNSDGGQWTGGGGGATSDTRIVSGHGRFGGGVAVARKPEAGPKAPDGTPVQLAGRAGGRVSVDQGNSDQPATKFTGTTRRFITQHAETARRVADKLGVSRNAVVGAVANEHDTRFNPDLTLGTRGGPYQAGGDWWVSDSTHQELADNYNALKAGNPNFGEKFGNPAMVDVGPGNIKIETAIDLLQEYHAEHATSGDDPLDLEKYVGHYDTMVKDLSDFDKTDTTFAFAALKVRNAEKFFTSKDNTAWNRLSDDVKDALRVTYYKMGEKTLSGNIDKRIAASKQNHVQFDFDPHGDGGQQHLNNLEEIKNAIKGGLARASPKNHKMLGISLTRNSSIQ